MIKTRQELGEVASVKDLAEYLGCTGKHILHILQAEHLEHYRIGRRVVIPVDSFLKRFLRQSA